ncbi:MAG: MarR family winged helix-turn-helix transcriptional regulator [Lactobacillus sp.]|jgi:DNA-binding MarR family transcriptional regulator|nr:MarR family winged helix-turn-helix transcriptional regulator [Lactobacillus sp.]
MQVLDFANIAGEIRSYIFHKLKLNSSQTRLVYYFLHNDNQAIKMGDLAAGLHISLSTLSRQLSQSKTASLIEVSKVPGNSAKTIKLNQKGLEKAQALEAALNELEEEIFGGWQSQDKDRFTEQLVEINGRLQTDLK